MSDPKKYLPPRRVMPGVPLPTLNQRNLDERSFHLSKIGADTFSGELVDCEGGTIIGPLTLSSDFAHNTGKFGVFGATAVAQIGGSIDVLAGMVTLGFRAASSNPPLNLGTGAITCGNLTHKGTLLGVYNTTPAAQPAGSTDVVASLVTVGLRAASSNPPLNLGTGAITAGNITFTGALNASGSDGTAGFVLTSNGAAVNPSWQAASGGGGGSLATLSDVTLAAVARGDVLYRGVSVWQNLAHGTSGQVLTTGGAGADPTWTTPTTGNATSTGAVGSEPGSPIAGDLYFPNNGYSVERYSGSSWSPWGPVFPLVKPDDSLYAWVNQGSASVATANGGIFLSAPAGAGSDSLHLRVKSIPGAPYTVKMAFLPMLVFPANFNSCGIVLRDSASGKLVTFHLGCDTGLSATVPTIAAIKWNSATSFNAFYALSPTNPPSSPWSMGPCMWLSIHDDSTNRTLSVSNDGVNFLTLLSVVRTDFITPDQIGYFINPNSASFGLGMNVISFTGG